MQIGWKKQNFHGWDDKLLVKTENKYLLNSNGILLWFQDKLNYPSIRSDSFKSLSNLWIYIRFSCDNFKFSYVWTLVRFPFLFLNLCFDFLGEVSKVSLKPSIFVSLKKNDPRVLRLCADISNLVGLTTI